MSPAGPTIHFLNVAYFFNLLYSAIFSFHISSLGDLETLASTAWLFISLIGYILVLVLIGLLVYFSTRLYQIADEDAKRYQTIHPEEAHAKVKSSRWAYVQELIESSQPGDWRTAIIEADIMLDELLTKLGYQGSSVGEKLKAVNAAHFHTLEDAWTAHRVRNEIAHQGSVYPLSDQLAYRTIAHYENVFREFDAI
jgi:hypothetical protein